MAIITLSRGTFSGGKGLAERIAGELGYRCVSREMLLETAARQYQVSEDKLSRAIDEAPGIWERLSSEKERYLACLRAALISEVKGDNVVYHGHAGHFLLQGVPCVLRVRVIANMEFRIAALTDHSNLSRQEALQFIRKTDEKRARWTRLLYHVDWRDPSLYDVVVNLDHASIGDACDIVCHMTNMDRFKPSPEWRKVMDDVVLSSHLEAIIANTPNIWGGKEVEINADGGVVTIGGTVGSLADADRVKVLVRKTQGVREVNSRMSVHLPAIPIDNIDLDGPGRRS